MADKNMSGLIGPMKQVKKPDDVPDGQHYAVIIYDQSSVHIPGDQRSIDCPGHGYPAHTETYDTFEHWVTEDVDVLQAFITKLKDEERMPYGKRRPFVFFKASGKGRIKLSLELQL